MNAVEHLKLVDRLYQTEEIDVQVKNERRFTVLNTINKSARGTVCIQKKL